MQHDGHVVVADGLSVTRGKTKALDNVSFVLEPGKITGLIGPSGSGKTTLMRVMVGAQVITRGTLRLLGQPAGSKQLRSRIGYLAQSPAIYDDLTTQQNLEYFASILGLDRAAVKRVIKKVDLQEQTSQLVGTMSGGQRARVSLAVALLNEPEILVLDEPTVGLDPVLRVRLWELFNQLAAEGRTLLISSHVMDEAEQCAQILLLRRGRVLRHASKEELLASTKTNTVHDAFLALAQAGVKS